MRRFTPRYDERLGDDLHEQQRKMQAIMKSMPQWRRELVYNKVAVSNAKLRKKKRGPDVDKTREAREEAEMQCAATLRKCIEALDMALTAINDAPAPSKYQSHVNVHALVNAVFILRHKCGLK